MRNLGRQRVKAYSTMFLYSANLTWVHNGETYSVVGDSHALVRELKKRLNMRLITLKRLAFQRLLKDERELLKWLSDTMQYELALGNVDILTSRTMISRKESIFDVIPSTMKPSKNVIIVPRAPFLTAWTLPLRVFGPDIWLALGGAAAAYALAWRAVAGASLAEGAAAALRAFSSCGGAPQGRVRASPQRLQLAGALLASAVVVVAAYQGRLFTLVTDPERGAEIDTIQQLADSGLEVDTNMMYPLVQFLQPGAYRSSNGDAAARRRVAAKEHKTTSNNILTRAIEGQRFAWATTENDWVCQSLSYYLYENMRPMKNDFFDSQLFLYTRRNWPWIDTVNRKVLECHAGGLTSKWEDDMTRNTVLFLRHNKEVDLPLKPTEVSGPKVLRPRDVVSHLELLGIGLTASALIFCTELWHGRHVWIQLRSRFGCAAAFRRLRARRRAKKMARAHAAVVVIAAAVPLNAAFAPTSVVAERETGGACGSFRRRTKPKRAFEVRTRCWAGDS